MMCVASAVQYHLREGSQIAGRREKSRVACHSAHRPRIFVMHLALQQTLPERGVVFGRSNARAERFRRIELSFRHCQRLENVPMGKYLESFPLHSLHDFAEKDETQV